MEFEGGEIEEVYVDDISAIPTAVLEDMYHQIWVELIARGHDPEKRELH